MSSRNSRTYALIGLVLVLAQLAYGCTLGTIDRVACESNTQCRTEFGLGSVCGEQGFCQQSEPFGRCLDTMPETLFTDPRANRDTVVIGNLMDRSLDTHRAREKAVRLAMEQANREGGIKELSFAVVFCTIEQDPRFDMLTRSQAAIESARYLVDVLGVPAIIGPASSLDTQSVFLNVARDAGVLLISPSATSVGLQALDPSMVSDEAPGLLWRTAPPDSLQGRAIAHDMTAPGPGRSAFVNHVALVHEIGAYGEGMVTVFEDAFDGMVSLFPYDDESSLVEAVAAAGVSPAQEVLFASSQSADVIKFLGGAVLSGYNDKGLFLTDSAANSDVLENADPTRFPQVRGSRPAPLDPVRDFVYSVFLTAYRTRYAEDATLFSFTANAYDAAWLVAYGTAWAHLQEGIITGRSIARGLRRLSSGDPVEIRPTTWNSVLQQFSSGLSVDVTGASGPLDYDPAIEETSGAIEIWKIQDDVITGVDTWPAQARTPQSAAPARPSQAGFSN